MDNQCYLRNCTYLTEISPKVKNLCQVPDTVKEDIDGCKFALEKYICVVLTNTLGMTELPGGLSVG